MWPDLPKEVLYTHSFKTYFSLSSVSYMIALTAHVFNTAEGRTVCFYLGLFLKPVWHPQLFAWPSNAPIFPWEADSWLWITTWLADEFGYGFSCFVWHVKVKMALMEVICFSEDVAFACHFMAPCPPTFIPPDRSASGTDYASKKSSKMVGNPASYPVYSRYSGLLWIAIGLWRNKCRQL